MSGRGSGYWFQRARGRAMVRGRAMKRARLVRAQLALSLAGSPNYAGPRWTPELAALEIGFAVRRARDANREWLRYRALSAEYEFVIPKRAPLVPS